jgi:protocatechuate 3,4-dioxygenase beta subunit
MINTYILIIKGCIFSFCLFTFAAHGQTIGNKVLKDDVAALQNMRLQLPIEKLYLQTDKPYYNSGDTLRFKSYLLNADFLTPSNSSGLLYVELDNASGKPVKRIMVAVNYGLAWGDIALDEKEIAGGSYTLRAYTNWMRNFGEDYIFKKNIYISAVREAVLVKSVFKLDSVPGKSKVSANLYFSSLNKDPLRLKDMKLWVTDGKHTLARDKVTTGIDGSLNFNFELTQKTDLKNLVIIATQTGKDADTSNLTIPVTIARPQDIDLQFMPEGGNLVAGIPNKIGFKAIGEDGKGLEISGNIYNSKRQVITGFKSLHAGMGSFELAPRPGESYTAEAMLSGGITKAYPLPAVNPAGTALAIRSSSNDSLVITVSNTGQKNANEIHYVIGQSRGVVCYARAISFDDNSNNIKQTIAKNLFPTGIARFTLLNATGQPLNERQVFVNHNDNLQFSISTDKQQYATRDSIALAIEVKDKDGNPVRGSFSLAVTDDSQVRTDSLVSNIVNNLLLTSDLKGNIEQPGYYFEGGRSEELDNLLLTQGWAGYSWKEVFNKAKAQPVFQAEKEFAVKGTVTNAFNKPVAGANLILISSKPPAVMDTVTGKDGRYYFKGLLPVDTALFKIQARTKKGSSLNINVGGEEFAPPKFGPSSLITPWYINSDTVLLKNNSTKAAQLKAVNDLSRNGRQLKEVTIKDKKIIPGSKNLNGPGQYDEAFDENDMKKANKMTLGDFLEKHVKGYLVNGIWEANKKPLDYVIYYKRAHFVIDGMDLEYFPAGSSRYQYIKKYLDYFTAEDITGIEVMYSLGFVGSYGMLNLPAGEIIGLPSHAWIEITTRAKKGPFMRVTPGTYLYKTLGFTLPKQFYSPKYTVSNKNASMGTDLRSTIDWAPNIITDSMGKANLSFYSADKPGSYNLIIEGTDLNGNSGYRQQKIRVLKGNVPEINKTAF